MGRRHPNNSNALGTDGISELGQVRGLYGELNPTSPRLNKRGRNQTSWVRSIRVPRDARVFDNSAFPRRFGIVQPINVQRCFSRAMKAHIVLKKDFNTNGRAQRRALSATRTRFTL